MTTNKTKDMAQQASMEVHAYLNKPIKVYDHDETKWKTDTFKLYRSAVICHGTPKRDCPKSYVKVGGMVAIELDNRYNSGLMHIYRAKDGTLRYSVYRDGCFWPYYGKIVMKEPVEEGGVA